jgi:urea transport system ATP-binding protein
MAPTLEIESLSVSFDGFKAVDDFNFTVHEDELRVVIGPNGAGKTTLLDLICGKTRPTSGKIKFKGRDISKMSENKIVDHGVGRKFQTPSIYPKLTVFQNLEISFPRGRGVWGSLFFRHSPDVTARVKEVAEQVYLPSKLFTLAEHLSHGQKQWLEIGMVLIADPQLMLLDEPVAGMSVRERQETAHLLSRICKGRSVVVIEHDMNFVKQIAHRVTVMHQGKLLAEGSMDEVQSNPKVVEVYLGH